MIPSQNCREGAELCLENANRLLQDAFILFEDKRYITTSCLAIYSFEEIGKGKELLELVKLQKICQNLNGQRYSALYYL